MAKNGDKKTLVLGYIKKYPNIKNRELGKLLIADHPAMFRIPGNDLLKDIDTARGLVRYVRGVCGAKNRSNTDNNPETKAASEAWITKKDIPEPHELVYEPYIIKGPAKILGLFDIHFPCHDQLALITALNDGHLKGADTILLGGDLVDNYDVSTFAKDPAMPRLPEEIRMVKEFLHNLRDKFPKAKIIYKEGNHEERLSRYIRTNARALAEFEEFQLPFILGLAALNIDWVGEKRIIEAGKLSIFHGHEFGSGAFSPVSAAKWLYDRTGEHSLCGHKHTISEYSKPTLKRNVRCFSVGCLCQLHPQYHPVGNKYQHGFCHIDLFADGEFRVQNKEIISGKIY